MMITCISFIHRIITFTNYEEKNSNTRKIGQYQGQNTININRWEKREKKNQDINIICDN
jgi:hypothetical protein